ncbi:hypothetical protein HDU93_006095 [Gonapodya sp. JEL0774]|nr:hypothetical protein HDU93_006095 [Gonapodya sp. JEL0774]
MDDDAESFPASVAESFPQEFERFSKLKLRAQTIESGARTLDAAINGQGAGHEGSQSVAELVQHHFHPSVYAQYLRWVPALDSVTSAAWDLKSHADSLVEAETDMLDAMAVINDREKPFEISVATQEQSLFPQQLQDRYADLYEEYLRAKQRVQDAEVAFTNFERASVVVEERARDFLGAVQAMDAASQTLLGAHFLFPVAFKTPPLHFDKTSRFARTFARPRRGSSTMSSMNDGLFPTSVALFHPDEFERYALLRERVATIERGALAVERAIRGFFPESDQNSGRRVSGETKPGDDNSLSDRVKHTFREDIVHSYNQWKPIIWDQEFAARELKAATDKVQETEEYFAATLDALEQTGAEIAVKYRTIKGTAIEDDAFPRATRSSHPEAFERYLRHKQKLREVEVAATMMEQVNKVLETKRRAFAVAAAAVDEASKSEYWDGFPYGLPVAQAGSSIAPSRRASSKSGSNASTAANTSSKFGQDPIRSAYEPGDAHQPHNTDSTCVAAATQVAHDDQESTIVVQDHP